MSSPGSATSPRLSIVVLAYNEATNVGAACAEIVDTLTSMAIDVELLIVDDGSTDATGRIADEIAAGSPFARVVHHPHNLGLGGGYRTGFREARGEFVSFFPADGQFPPEIIPQFYATAQGADLVLGYIPTRRSSLVAKGLSFAERVLYRAMFGPFPKFQGILMVRRSVLGEIRLVSDGRGWTVVMEMILRVSRGPYRVKSLPTTLRARMSGASKVNNWRTIRANLEQMWELYRRQ